MKTNYRTAVTIPEKSWSRFRDIFSDYVEKMKEGGGIGGSSSGEVGGGASVTSTDCFIVEAESECASPSACSPK